VVGLGQHYSDTIDGLRVINNTVIRGPYCFINNSPNHDKNIVILHNYFDIQNRVAGGASYGVGNTGNGLQENWQIDDNTIIEDAVPGHGYYEVRGTSVGGSYRNVGIYRNIVQCTNSNYAVGPHRSGNRDAQGHVVPGSEDNLAVIA